MTYSSPKLNYSWEELRPVHPLCIVIFVAQVVGAGASLLIGGLDDWYYQVWLGAALMTFPGFLAGLPVQHVAHPGSLAEHRPKIFLLGAISLFFLVAALTIPPSAVGGT
jgi:hypothetical protein